MLTLIDGIEDRVIRERVRNLVEDLKYQYELLRERLAGIINLQNRIRAARDQEELLKVYDELLRDWFVD